MNIAICGATGFVGRHLHAHLEGAGHHVTPIGRNLLQAPQHGNLQDIIDKSNVIINLAGSPINVRWNHHNMQQIISSRIKVTKLLVDMINRSDSPALFICASANGFHSSELSQHPDIEEYKETTLGQLVAKWEGQARRLNCKTRLVLARFSLIFSPKEGALKELISTRKFGFLAEIGDSNKLISWISIEDVVRAIERIIHSPNISGAIIFAAPKQTTQLQLLTAAKRTLGVHHIIRIPSFIIRLMYGKSAQIILQSGYQKPNRLLEMGLHFRYPTIDDYFSNHNFQNSKNIPKAKLQKSY